MIARFLKRRLNWVRWTLFFTGFVPFFWLLWHWHFGDLGPNPLETITSVTGLTAMYFLWVTLLITPLRRWLSQWAQWRRWSYGKRVADWNSLVRLRRQLGLWSFAYAVLHAITYFEFDSGWSLTVIIAEAVEKPYLSIGLLALIGLIPLAITSPSTVMRTMGSRWLRLHRSVYVISILVLCHYALQTKQGYFSWIPEAVALLLLLGYRLAAANGWINRWAGQDGFEAPERLEAKPAAQ